MGQNQQVSAYLEVAIRSGKWRDPGPHALRRILGASLDLPDLELFATPDAMQAVKEQVESGGYLDDPEFCMIRDSTGDLPTNGCLVFDTALFIAGSVDPGDDVFVVADKDMVRVFDWRQRTPERWVTVDSFEAFVDALALASK